MILCWVGVERTAYGFMDNINFDIVVIGSGVIGHSIAFRIKQDAPQLKIAVLGDPVNSLQASRAAAGMLAPFCE